jgi:hypothetical protein
MGYWMEDKGLLPTPAQRDYKGANGMEHMSKNAGKRSHMGQLPNAVTYQIGQRTGTQLRLEPAFALWMMGFPEDWLDLPDGE